MLIRPVDADEDEDRWRAFVTAQGFGHLAASGTGHPTAVLVPTQFVLVGDEVVLHLAAPNPVFDRLAENPRAILSVAGDWAYVPAAWKAIGEEDPSMGIPTTYYAAVQLTGEVTVVDDPAGMAEILRLQLGELEPDGGAADPAVHEKKFRAIRGLRLAIDEVRAKYKFGGNVDVEHRAAVAERLAERAGPGDAEARAHIPGLD